MQETKNKYAIITGSNRGIGKSLVREFAKQGYNIFACARKQNDFFEAFIYDVSIKENVIIEPIYFDLSNEKEVIEGIKQILGKKVRIDVLINNAGIAHGGLMAMTPISTIREVYEINVFAQIQIMQLVSRKMMKQQSGCIINMCSVGGIETNPGYLAYGSSKAALIWITKSVAKELGMYNIRVNGIAPGLIDTELGHYKSDEELKKVIDRMSLKRMGKPEEIAKAAVYLASADAGYITGQILVLDGGR